MHDDKKRRDIRLLLAADVCLKTLEVLRQLRENGATPEARTRSMRWCSGLPLTHKSGLDSWHRSGPFDS